MKASTMRVKILENLKRGIRVVKLYHLRIIWGEEVLEKKIDLEKILKN